MATRLDILVLDDSFEKVRVLYKKYPSHSIRKAISGPDFITSLELQPRLIIIGNQKEYTPEQLEEILSNRLTADTNVLTWGVHGGSSEVTRQLSGCPHVVCAAGFDFTNRYLWISIYNILNG